MNLRNHPAKDHKGNSYPSIREMCDAYHIKESLFLKRIERNWTLKEALEGKEPYYVAEDGTIYQTQKDFYEALGISRSTYTRRIKEGYSKEDFFTDKLRGKYEDPNTGILYPTLKELNDANKMNMHTFRGRMQISNNDLAYALQDGDMRIYNGTSGNAYIKSTKKKSEKNGK